MSQLREIAQSMRTVEAAWADLLLDLANNEGSLEKNLKKFRENLEMLLNDVKGQMPYDLVRQLRKGEPFYVLVRPGDFPGNAWSGAGKQTRNLLRDTVDRWDQAHNFTDKCLDGRWYRGRSAPRPQYRTQLVLIDNHSGDVVERGQNCVRHMDSYPQGRLFLEVTPMQSA